MTKPPVANPQPTSGTNYDSFLVPRSKTPAKQRFYDWLLEHGWRYSQATVEWFTPEGDVLQARGRFSYETDYSRAWISPPNAGHAVSPPPILVLVVDANGQVVEAP